MVACFVIFRGLLLLFCIAFQLVLAFVVVVVVFVVCCIVVWCIVVCRSSIALRLGLKHPRVMNDCCSFPFFPLLIVVFLVEFSFLIDQIVLIPPSFRLLVDCCCHFGSHLVHIVVVASAIVLLVHD